jgi:hypothetical protein
MTADENVAEAFLLGDLEWLLGCQPACFIYRLSETKRYIPTAVFNLTSFRPGVLHMEKQIHVKIDKKSDLTLREVLRKIEEIQAEHPELDVFFDGDIYAICSRPRKQPEQS